MTRATEIKAGMKFNNYGDVMEVVSVEDAGGEIIIQWSGFYGSEILDKADAVYMPRA